MSFVLLNDADLVTIHEIGKAILCLVRDWCNRCGLHGVSRRDVHNLVDLADLVENECATKKSGTSRRVQNLISSSVAPLS